MADGAEANGTVVNEKAVNGIAAIGAEKMHWIVEYLFGGTTNGTTVDETVSNDTMSNESSFEIVVEEMTTAIERSIGVTFYFHLQ